MTNQPNPIMPEQESLQDIKQHLRFEILVPFYVAMEEKRVEDVNLDYMQDASKIYGKTVDEIMHLIEQDRERAVKQYHNEITANETKVWITKEDFDNRIAKAVMEAKLQEQRFLSGAIDRGENIIDWNRKRKSELTEGNENA